jgi:uncharacterized protein DUF3443
MMRVLRGAGLLICLSAISCGGGGGGSLTGSGSSGTTTTTPAANLVSVAVNGGPAGSTNTLFTTITVCVPGSTTNCQTIGGIQIDTGSYGLRLLASAVTLSLPVTAAASGGSLLECTPFLDGYSWGPISQVDLQVSGETASSVPVQLIGDSRFPTVPSDCVSSAPTEEDTVASFGANGILGIGPFVQDCGTVCVGTAIPAAYYACTSATACTNTTVALASQVQNPVTFFSVDNNGTIISLPKVASGGAESLTGSLIFGIDTQSNNQLSGQTVLAVDPDSGYITTMFGTQTLSSSFIDSGSNGIYFNDSSIATCTGTGFTNFYCPAATDNLSAALQGQNADGTATSTSISENFFVSNAQAVSEANPDFTVLPGLAGTTSGSDTFDWGLPFFYGRNVATAIQGYTTSAGTGPYIAF